MSDKGHCVIDASAATMTFTPEELVEREGDVRLECIYEVRNKDGSLAHRQIEEGDSFLANFLKFLYCEMAHHWEPRYNGGQLTLKDTGGNNLAGSDSYAINWVDSQSWFLCNAPSGNDDYGILVGTGNTAVDIEDYALDTQVIEGTGAGQMEYGNHSIVNSTHDGSTYSYAGITRTVANNSGGSVVIAEVGLVTYAQWDGPAYDYFMLLREVLGSPVTVLNTQTLTATIRIKCYC